MLQLVKGQLLGKSLLTNPQSGTEADCGFREGG